MQWFNDVYSTDISDRCEDVLDMLLKTHGCEVSFLSISIVVAYYIIIFVQVLHILIEFLMLVFVMVEDSGSCNSRIT